VNKSFAHYQERGINWCMNARLKPFSVGKFVLHGCGPQEYREILHKVSKKFCPVYAVTQTN
jgi:hypothetical protein